MFSSKILLYLNKSSGIINFVNDSPYYNNNYVEDKTTTAKEMGGNGHGYVGLIEWKLAFCCSVQNNLLFFIFRKLSSALCTYYFEYNILVQELFWWRHSGEETVSHLSLS